MSSQPVCQFYQQGRCKFGSNCRNAHIDPPNGQNPSWARPDNARLAEALVGKYTAETMQADVASDKPLWELSSYGPGKHQPTFVEVDVSPEELRLKAVEALKSGNSQQYMEFERAEIEKARAIYQGIVTDPANAHKAAFIKFRTAEQQQNPLNSGAGFGQSNPFGQPASTFGQTSAFGAPKPFGAPTTTSFGQPSAFAQSTSSAPAFGKPAFGQSAFGQPSFGQSAFSQPAAAAAPATSSSGGGFAAFASKPATFGQPAFGQSGFAAAAPAFGQSSANPGTGFAAFASAAPTSFAAVGAGTTGFAQPAFAAPAAPQPPPSNPFAPAQSAQPPSNPFSAPASGGGFASFANPTGAATGFAAPVTLNSLNSGSANTATNVFGGTTNAVSNPGFAVPSAPVQAPASTSGFMSTTTTQPPTNLFNAPKSTPFGNPSGASRAVKDPSAAQLPPNYLDMLPPDVRAAFDAERFEFGKIPTWIPPIELR